MGAWTEVVRRIGHGDYEGHYLSVCPGPDAPDMLVLLHTEGEDNAKFFGEVRLECSADVMRALGKALIDCADEVDRERRLASTT